MTRELRQDIEYVDVRSSRDPSRPEPKNFYEKWLDQSSAKHATPELIAADAAQRMYPGYSLVVSDDYRLSNLLTLPGVTIDPPDPQVAVSEQVSNVVFTPMPTRIGDKVIGSLVDHTIVGTYGLTWNNGEFVVHVAKNGNIIRTVYFILHDGPEQSARDFVLAVCLYSEQAHDEIWVFNRGNWSKDKSLWLGIKDSSWDDVVTKEERKKALQKDVYGFFKSETIYKKLSIPWKRGLIMYGPPGNGKTISIKVIMKTCVERGFIPLYVKSLQSPFGEEAAIQNVFLKTRQLAPCVLIMEDLDSLINDQNRSFFLNELDGLEGNNGLLVITSTNHFERLDPGLSNRPSRFDRKYLFDDPDYEERVLYAKYWQEKLKDNDKISFSESLVKEVAELAQGFSFAYLKEAFVSTLVRISNADDGERVEFPDMLKSQTKALRKELGEKTPTHVTPRPPIAQPQRELDERTSRAEHSWTTSQEGTSSRGPVQPSSSAGASPADISDDSVWLPTTPTARRSPTNSAEPHWQATARVFGTASTARSSTYSPQGYVLPAPPSAYPQVMPGSLPSTRPEPSQDPNYATRRTALAFDTAER